ncbi:MAG: sulfite exporter TauE/SafE family protein [Bacteroidales bacterium]|nr:sulfite exporter TauE/SafE family protein [Bacteroidales bacterium]
MSQELLLLTITAASIGFFHTLFGPDHYLPFIVMSKARSWSMVKTSWITFLCGVGHILSSVLLGMLGIALGIAVNTLVDVESFRGEIAAWMLIAFGLVYMLWGIRRAIRNRPHSHFHAHENVKHHSHIHSHHDEHTHVHQREGVKSLTPWILFTIFLFGPCEPLIPILMYPAATESFWSVVWIAAVFGSITIGTMMTIVLISSFGIQFLPLKKMERYMHAIAGATILLCGLSIQFLGL